MAFKITDNTKNIKSVFSQRASIFLRLTAESIVATSEKKTPKKEGNLRRDVLKQVLGLKGRVIWAKNYAEKMEINKFRKYTTPGTGPHFAENAVKEIVEKTGSIARSSGLIL